MFAGRELAPRIAGQTRLAADGTKDHVRTIDDVEVQLAPQAETPAEMLAEAAKYIAEFVGTFVLVFTVGSCVLAGSPAWNATAIGGILMVMVYATSSVSGGHLNPAVSMALYLTRNMERSTMFKYWAAQVAGAFSAAACVAALFSPKELSLGPVAPFVGCHAMVAEVIYTSMLCFVVLCCAASKRNNSPGDGNQFYALAIGFVIIAGGYAVGGISGAAFNPAVALALDLRHAGFGWGIWYTLFQLTGASLAAWLYTVVRPDETMQPQEIAGYVPSLRTKCVSEFLGVFIIVLTVGLNLITSSPATALSVAAALMCMVYSLGDVSGAHFNPAVTVAVVVRGVCSHNDGLAYAIVQMGAGMFAGLICSMFHVASPSRGVTFGVEAGHEYSFFAAGFVELFFTFVLAYVVLATATTKPSPSQITRQKYYFALSISACVTAGGFAVGAVSGGQLNPAVCAGLSTLGSMSPGTTPVPSYTYLVGFSMLQLIGGVCATLVFRITHPTEANPKASVDVVPVICEFVGTFVLVFTVGCCVLAGNGAWNATSIASVLMAMIYSLGPVSGGNLNPAVSLALGLTGDLQWPVVFKYWAAQLLGGLLAGGTYCAVFAPRAAVLTPVEPYGVFWALLAEVLYTFMLCFVVLNCAASKRNNPASDGNQFYALAIGFVIIAGGYAVGGVSGAAFNPAVALGLDIKHVGFRWGVVWAGAELFGAVLAALLYFLLRPDERLAPEDRERYTPQLYTRCLSEGLGAFMLVLTVGLNLVNGSVATAWSAAAALMCMIYSLGNVSGAHFNPAVTLAVVVSGREKCSTMVGAAYVVSQMVGGAMAGLLTRGFHANGPNATIRYALHPGLGFNPVVAGLAELVFTAVLAYVVLAVATTTPPKSQLTKHNFHFALSIGSCVTAGGIAIGTVSGGELNPAVAIGIVTLDMSLGCFVTFATCELAGGLLAAMVFRLTHPWEFKAPSCKTEFDSVVVQSA